MGCAGVHPHLRWRTPRRRGAALAFTVDHRCRGAHLRCDIPGIAIQAAGLLPGRDERARRELAPHAQTLAEQVPREGWRYRAEVISVEEALAALGVER